MTRPARTKLNPDLAAVLPLAELDLPAAALLGGCVTSAEGLERLRAAGALAAAVRLAAAALPHREAVWWASMCVRHTAPPDQPAAEIQARDAAELWVRQQDDATRRSAMDLARQAGFGTPEAWVAVAAFWSGDSMAPPGQPLVPAGPKLVGTAVCGANTLAAVRGDPRRRDARLGRFLASMDEIALGGAGRLGNEMTTG